MHVTHAASASEVCHCCWMMSVSFVACSHVCMLHPPMSLFAGRCGWDRFSSAQQDTLALAGDLFRSRHPIETDDTTKPRAMTIAMNHGHALDTCALCHTEFGTLMRASQHCARCGINVCAECSTKQLVFHGRGAAG